MSAANQTTVNKNTIFIASITKIFTTLLLADMADYGIVNLNDSIEKYLPNTVNVPTYNGQKITLEDLATHTSGLPDYPPNMPLYGPGSRNIHSSKCIMLFPISHSQEIQAQNITILIL